MSTPPDTAATSRTRFPIPCAGCGDGMEGGDKRGGGQGVGRGGDGGSGGGGGVDGADGGGGGHLSR